MYDIEKQMGRDVKLGRTYVTLEIKEGVDLAAYRTIMYAKPGFVVPFSGSEVDGEYLLSFDVAADDFVSLKNFDREMSPQNFVAFMKNVTDAVLQCTDYQASCHNLLLTEEFVYINPQSFDVRFIYAPLIEPILSESELNREVYSLMRKFVGDPSNIEWQGIIARLWKVSENTSVYEAGEIYTTLKKELVSPKPPQQVQRPPIQQPPQMPPQVQPQMPPQVPPQMQPQMQQQAPPTQPLNVQAPQAPQPKGGIFSGIFGRGGLDGQTAQIPQSGGMFSGQGGQPAQPAAPPDYSGLSKKEQKKLEKEAAKQAAREAKEAKAAAKAQAKLDQKNKKGKKGEEVTGGIFSGQSGETPFPQAQVTPIPVAQPMQPIQSAQQSAPPTFTEQAPHSEETMFLDEYGADGADNPDATIFQSQPILQIIKLGSVTETVEILQTPFIIGRQPSAAGYAFDQDRYIGKQHAQIDLLNDQYCITDLSSKNGTYINGVRIPNNTPTALATGDLIKLGNAELKFDC
ncbi:MAG: FHA domain-containing protein [Defluviitaleaceae bacterium]|nr:FHA domain-containing protein [Defluviitaleaceae bacterium]